MHLLDNGIAHHRVGIDERDETGRLRRQLTQQSEPFRGERHVEGHDSRGVAARPIETGDETQRDGVGFRPFRAKLRAKHPSTIVNRTVTPRRPPNADLQEREYRPRRMSTVSRTLPASIPGTVPQRDRNPDRLPTRSSRQRTLRIDLEYDQLKPQPWR